MYKCIYCGAVVSTALDICPACYNADALEPCDATPLCPVPNTAQHYTVLPANITRSDGVTAHIHTDSQYATSVTAPGQAGIEIILGQDYLNANPALQDFILHHEIGHFMLDHLGAIGDYVAIENAADRYAIACGCNPQPFLAWLKEFTGHVSGRWHQRNHALRITLLENTIGE